MSDILFVRNDGLFAVAHIDSAGELVETDVGHDATLDWTHIVPVGKDILFVRNDGLFAVAHINTAGELVETHAGDDATPDWTHVMPVA
ncbi:MAG: hypothetical protein H0V41_11010 [Pseudonocardiales bacterium]|nr:hypothetical protein [Pseudonocardiales bacterium]